MNVPWSNLDFGKEEKEAVNRVMDSGWLTMGKETERFEEELADFLGCPHVICVNSGTSALAVALKAHDVSTAVIPSYAYPSLLNVLRSYGIHNLVNDVNPKTVHMRNDQRQEEVTYVPTSFAGMPLNKRDWRTLLIIEDAGESFGATSGGVKVGNQGWTSTFSFHIAKTITTVEGGAVATCDVEVAEKARKIRHRSFLNYQTTDINSAIGRVQLRKVLDYLTIRAEIAGYYREELDGLAEFQKVPKHVEIHANMMFPIFVSNPYQLSKQLRQDGIDTRLGWAPIMCTDNSMKVNKRIICLPIFNTMTMDEVKYVVKCLKRCL